MELDDAVQKFYEFFQGNNKYYSKILESIRKKQRYIKVDFQELAEFDVDLSDAVLDKPEEHLKYAEMAIREFNFPEDLDRFIVRFYNLPESQRIFIKDIRSVHLDKLYFIEGIVRQKSDVRPRVTMATFECPACGNQIKVPQIENKFKEPHICPACGRKGKFKLIEKKLIDAQGLVIEEAPEFLEGGEQPKRLQVVLTDDLTSSEMEKVTNPGNKIRIIGVLKEVPVVLKNGAQSVRYEIRMDSIDIEPMEEIFSDIKISEEEEEEIIELSKKPNFLEMALKSVAPGIYGHEKIKEAMLLQFVSGVRKSRDDGVVTRGDIHILIVGDPGAGKSQLLKRAQVVAPKARYVSGKGASGAGLTAAVVKDEFLGGWSLEAGALVLANGGICLIDELDKMTNEDRSAMHEALEQQTITISKANIQATLRAQTTVLAAANPKLGRFNPYENLATQIDLPPALISRFDLIFPIKDMPDEKRDREMAEFILKLHKEKDTAKPPIETQMLRKYLAYAKQRITPNISNEAMEEIEEYYVRMRNTAGSEGDIKTIPITPRQLEALVRLSEASAKLKLSPVVKREHARRAIDLLEFCLKAVGMDPSTGKIDIDSLVTGIASSERNVILVVREVINSIAKESDNEMISIEDIKKKCEEKKIEEDKVDEVLEKLKRKGDIFEPRRGFIQKL